MRTDYMRNH